MGQKQVIAATGSSWWAKSLILLGGAAIGVAATLAVTRFDPAGPASSGPERTAAPAAAAPAATDLYALLRRGKQFPQSTPDMATNSATSGLPTVESMVEGLQARLMLTPDDPEGWRMLGWSYVNLGRFDEAVAAYREAVARAPGDAKIVSALGEALVRQADGKVTDEAAELFRQATSLDPDEAPARFFLGLAKDQAGNPAGAIKDWLALIEEAQPGADYTLEIRDRVIELASASGIELGDRLTGLPTAQPTPSAIPIPGPIPAPMPTPTQAPTQAQIAAAEAMPAADRQAMIRGMVEGLEARLAGNPNDAEGWVRLIRSWSVMGDAARAEQALRRATEAFAGDPATREAILGQAAGLGVVLR